MSTADPVRPDPTAPDYRPPHAVGGESDSPRLDGAAPTAASGGPVRYGSAGDTAEPSGASGASGHPRPSQPAWPPPGPNFPRPPRASGARGRGGLGTVIVVAVMAVMLFGAGGPNSDPAAHDVSDRFGQEQVFEQGAPAPVEAGGAAANDPVSDADRTWLQRGDRSLSLAEVLPQGRDLTAVVTGTPGRVTVQWLGRDGTQLHVRASVTDGELPWRVPVDHTRAVRLVLEQPDDAASCRIMAGDMVLYDHAPVAGECIVDLDWLSPTG